MTRSVRRSLLALWCLSFSSAAYGQEAILPQGDPRLQSSEEEQARREAVRDSRLKQQGQGQNYRIEGEPRPGETGATAGDPNGLRRQDTGIEDPTVNPGQAAGMRSVRGRIVQSEANTHVLRELSGADVTLKVDERTAGDKDLQPGDVITGFVTSEGRAVAIQKATKDE